MFAPQLPAAPPPFVSPPGVAGGRRRALPRRPPPFLADDLAPPPGALPTAALQAGALTAAGETPALPGEWQRIRRYAGGALLVLCFALFGWQLWRGRAPAPVVVDAS